ncbi:MAG: hypothetical protein MUP69_10190 [Candidatus Atribacteria bacterium]|nr:hypothetical protein [Candidatus Atribacteria bacterium]
MTIIWTRKWAEMHGLDIKYADEALKMISELCTKTDYDEDLIEAVVLSSYPLNLPESIFEKIAKSNKVGKGEIVKFTTYAQGQMCELV